MNRESILPEPHYHIRWDSPGALDWERHLTRAAAEESAEQLARTDERYKVEEFDASCAQCGALARSRAGKAQLSN